MILNLFTTVGTTMSAADAYTSLIALYAGQQFATKKAAGCLGGSVNGGTLVLLKGGYYVRVR